MSNKNNKLRRRGNGTLVEKLFNVLSDGAWHSTKELARRVSHCFTATKFRLVGYGHRIERRTHPNRRHQFQYRLHSGDE